jgi:putative PIN family toxin of toxin-antitoxin system
VIRAVLDTNVLASGFIRRNPGAAPTRILDAWVAGRFELIYSDEIITELERTFQSPYFARRLSRGQIGQALLLLIGEATRTEINVLVSGVATHPEDDRILAAAVSAGVDYLVTGDTSLQALGSLQNVQIVNPRGFLGRLDPSPRN